MNNSEEQWNNCFESGKKFQPINHYFLVDLFATFDLKSSSRFLDIGCGDGETVVRLAQLGLSGIGIDFSQKALEIASAKAMSFELSDKISFRNRDIANISSLSEEIYQSDLIITKFVIAYIENRREWLLELKTNMKQGSKLVIITPIYDKGKIDYIHNLEICVERNNLFQDLIASFEKFAVINRSFCGDNPEIIYIALQKD